LAATEVVVVFCTVRGCRNNREITVTLLPEQPPAGAGAAVLHNSRGVPGALPPLQPAVPAAGVASSGDDRMKECFLDQISSLS
jgi:hypothetical protein